MSYFGPHLEPGPDGVSIWNWLLESNSSPFATENGFVDGTTGAFVSHSSLKTVATAASIVLARDYDLGAGQTVTIVGRNSIWYPVAIFSAARLGTVVAVLPPEAKHTDLVYFFEASKAVMVFADVETVDEVKQACLRLNIPFSRIITLNGSIAGTTSLQDVITRGNDLTNDFIIPWNPSNKDTSPCAFLCFSSGTTGKPKPIMISHLNIISQLRQMRHFIVPEEQNTILGVLPFYHITGLLHLLHLPIFIQQNVVIMSKFEMSDMLKVVKKYRCNELWLVPPLLIRLVNDPIVPKYDLSFVVQFNTGAAPLSEKIIGKLEARFPNVRLRQAWGMTETTSCLSVTPPNLSTWANATKVGKLVPGTEIRIVDPDTMQDMPKGQVGELWAKGPQITMGYLNRPEEEQETYVSGGFLRTGDLGCIDNEGFVTIHDRIKEMIKVRGHGIAPAELEDLLHGHPIVSDVAIIGISHEYSGEVPRAFVVVKPGVPENTETGIELQEFVKAKKTRHKRLTGGVEFVSQIPRSAAGKILRRVLKDRWKQSQKTVVQAKI